MAITLIATPSPRNAATAPVQRASSRVYSPFPTRRLLRPMAVPIEKAPAEARKQFVRRA